MTRNLIGLANSWLVTIAVYLLIIYVFVFKKIFNAVSRHENFYNFVGSSYVGIPTDLLFSIFFFFFFPVSC